MGDFEGQVNPWETVTGLARQIMRSPVGLDHEPDRVLRNIASILFEPSFDAAIRWEVYELRDESRDDVTYAAARRCWRQDIDLRALDAPDRLAYLRRRHLGPTRPTIEAGQCPLDPTVVDPLVRRLPQSIAFVDPPLSYGVADGDRFEVTFGGVYYRITVEWHNQLPVPEEWREMVEAVRALFAHCEDCYTKQS